MSKLSHKTKIIIGIVLVVIVFIAVHMFAQSSGLKFCTYSQSGNELCFGESSSGAIFSIVASNSAGKSTVAPSETVNVAIYVEVPRKINPPIYTAQVLLKSSTGAVIDIWDVKSEISKQSNIAACLSGFGSCLGQSVSGSPRQVMTFKAPSTAGQYKVQYVVKDGSAGSVLIDESTTINVISPQSTTCPTNSCQAWTMTAEITNGEYQSRTCLKYDSACKEMRGYEYRTVCDNTYLVKGTTGGSGTGYGTCVKFAAPTPVTPTPQPTPPSEPVVDNSKQNIYSLTNNECNPAQVPVGKVLVDGFEYATLTECQSNIKADVVDTSTPTVPSTPTQSSNWFANFWQSILDFFSNLFAVA